MKSVFLSLFVFVGPVRTVCSMSILALAVKEFAGLTPRSGTFIHQLSLTHVVPAQEKYV